MGKIIIAPLLSDYDTEDLRKIKPPLIYTAFASILGRDLANIEIPGEEIITLQGIQLFSGDDEDEWRIDLKAHSNKGSLARWHIGEVEPPIQTALTEDLISQITNAINRITSDVEFDWEAGNLPMWSGVIYFNTGDISEFLGSKLYYKWVSEIQPDNMTDVDRLIYKSITNDNAVTEQAIIALLSDEEL